MVALFEVLGMALDDIDIWREIGKIEGVKRLEEGTEAR